MPKAKAIENSNMLPHGPRPTMTARMSIERPMRTAATQVAEMAKAPLVVPGAEPASRPASPSPSRRRSRPPVTAAARRAPRPTGPGSSCRPRGRRRRRPGPGRRPRRGRATWWPSSGSFGSCGTSLRHAGSPGTDDRPRPRPGRQREGRSGAGRRSTCQTRRGRTWCRRRCRSARSPGAACRRSGSARVSSWRHSLQRVSRPG